MTPRTFSYTGVEISPYEIASIFMDTETSLLCKYHDLPHEIVADAVGEAKVKYYLYANQALRCRIMEARKWIFTVAEHELHDAIAYESRFRHFDVSDRFSFYASADIICEKTRIRAYSFITQQYSTPSFEDSLLNTMALNAALGRPAESKARMGGSNVAPCVSRLHVSRNCQTSWLHVQCRQNSIRPRL